MTQIGIISLAANIEMSLRQASECFVVLPGRLKRAGVLLSA